MVGYYFENFQNDRPEHFRNNILKNGITVGEYFGTSVRPILSKPTRKFLSSSTPKRSQVSEQYLDKPLEPMDETLDIAKITLAIQNKKNISLFGLSQPYSDDYVAVKNEALKRDSYLPSPDIYIVKNRDA